VIFRRSDACNYDCHYSIDNCEFSQNNVSTYGSGLSIFGFGKKLLKMSNTIFRDNIGIGSIGSAFYADRLNVSINHSTFSNNSCAGDGGGLYFDITKSGTCAQINCFHSV
jgi:predicted outer membrane repeat protein